MMHDGLETALPVGRLVQGRGSFKNRHTSQFFMASWAEAILSLLYYSNFSR